MGSYGDVRYTNHRDILMKKWIAILIGLDVVIAIAITLVTLYFNMVTDDNFEASAEIAKHIVISHKRINVHEHN